MLSFLILTGLSIQTVGITLGKASENREITPLPLSRLAPAKKPTRSFELSGSESSLDAPEQADSRWGGGAEDLIHVTITPRDMDDAVRVQTIATPSRCKLEDGTWIEPSDPEFVACIRQGNTSENIPGIGK